MNAALPRIALTLGDVAGIGPELVARAVVDPSTLAISRPLVIGHPEIVRRTAKSLGIKFQLAEVASINDIDNVSTAIPCWNPGRDDVLDVPLGQIDPRAGRAAYDYLVGATQAALSGAVDAIVTAPLSKAALYAAGLKFPGHTEILAAECGVADVAMMLYLPPGEAIKNPFGLGVAHATLHTSIRSVPDLLTTERIAETIQLLDSFLKSVGSPSPRIGVCALNPHAGEDGIFGDEESRVIAPAVQKFLTALDAEQLRKLEAQARVDERSSLACASGFLGACVVGPIPADALMRRAAAGEFDGVVAMYHDQGHIALKLLGFDRAVNITLGLSIIRTSPSHGTAFDIAGKGVANPAGLIEAIRMAATLYEHRDIASAKRR